MVAALEAVEDGAVGFCALAVEDVGRGADDGGRLRTVGDPSSAAESAPVAGGRDGLRVGVLPPVAVLDVSFVDELLVGEGVERRVALPVAVAGLDVGVDFGGVEPVSSEGPSLGALDPGSLHSSRGVAEESAPRRPGMPAVGVFDASVVLVPGDSAGVCVPVGFDVGRAVPGDVARGFAVGLSPADGAACGSAAGVRVGPRSTITVTAPSTCGGITTVIGASGVASTGGAPVTGGLVGEVGAPLEVQPVTLSLGNLGACDGEPASPADGVAGARVPPREAFADPPPSAGASGE